ncbi:MAG: hemerythrin domain-containing protein [Endomicrobiales bacterium]|jgi:hemerythrin-like domain-containing protein
MDSSRNILSLLYKTHDTMREQHALLQEAVMLLDTENVWEKIDDIFSFFTIHLTTHFKKEEIVMDVAAHARPLDDRETAVFNEVFREHVEISLLYERLKTLKNAATACDKESKENYIATFNDVVEQLIKHAQKEDRILYPLLDKRMDEAQRQEAWRRVTAL